MVATWSSCLTAGQAYSTKKHTTAKEIRSLTNPLDSCPPEQKRGKEREKPKQKKPSTLKKVKHLFFFNNRIVLKIYIKRIYYIYYVDSKIAVIFYFTHFENDYKMKSIMVPIL